MRGFRLDLACLVGADLSGVRLDWADLNGAHGLTQDQIDSIRYLREYPPEIISEDLTLPSPMDD